MYLYQARIKFMEGPPRPDLNNVLGRRKSLAHAIKSALKWSKTYPVCKLMMVEGFDREGHLVESKFLPLVQDE